MGEPSSISPHLADVSPTQWKPVIPPIVLGLLLRGALAPYMSWDNDVAVWMRTSLSGFYGLPLYSRPGYSYPPVWGYCLELIGMVVRFVGGSASFFGTQNVDFAQVSVQTAEFSSYVTSPAFNLVFKGLIFIFDLGVAMMVYRLVLACGGSARSARIALVMWFLNPLVIWESAVQGAFDSLVGLSIVAAVLFVLTDRPLWAGSAWAVGIMIKLAPAILVMQLVLGLWVAAGLRTPETGLGQRLRVLGLFALGASVTLGLIATPLIIGRSYGPGLHDVFARGDSPVVIGGLSFTAARYLKPFSFLLLEAYRHSAFVIRVTSLAQLIGVMGWVIFGLVVTRRNPQMGFVVGAMGTLATFTLFAPISNPQYIMWWLPLLIAAIAVLRTGYWQLAVISTAPVVFIVGILGPAAFFASLSTYTHVISAEAVAAQVGYWYQAPGRLWGAYMSDDIFAPTALATIAAVGSVLITVGRVAASHRRPNESSSI